MKGIIIVACGHPTYGEWAFNLALSIKNKSNIPIAVLHTVDSLSTLDEERLAYFDYKIFIPEKEYRFGGKNHYQRVKTCIYDYSPFKETLYIDADSLMTRDVTALFDQKLDFNIGCMGYYDFRKKTSSKETYTYWFSDSAGAQGTKDHYKLKGKLPKTYSGLIYFRKKKKIKKLFDTIKMVYDDQSNRNLIVSWAGDIPDEYCFNVGCCIEKVYPDFEWMPVYFHPFFGKKTNYEIIRDFYGLTVAGNVGDNYLKTVVYMDELRKLCYPTFRVVVPVDKADVLPERKHL